jgi:hypothetical protein
MHPHFRRLVYPADARLKNRFSASADKESQGGRPLQLPLAWLSPAEQVSPPGKSARAGTGHCHCSRGRLFSPKDQRESPGNAQNGKTVHNLTASFPAEHFFAGSHSRLTSKPDRQNSRQINDR